MAGLAFSVQDQLEAKVVEEEATARRGVRCEISTSTLAPSVSTSSSPRSSLASEEGREINIAEPVAIAKAHFISDCVAFGAGTWGPRAGQGRMGYSVPSELLQETMLPLLGIPEHATLEGNGMELLSIREELAAEGLTEATLDATVPEHRRIVGRLLIAAAEARFGQRAIHLADTSRVSGDARYGEATVRCTRTGSTLRAAQHVVHVDKFLPGIARLHGRSGARAGAESLLDAYWPLWKQDFTGFGITKEAAMNYVCGASPGMLNLWVSLTPGEISQQPLAVGQALAEEDLDLVSTHAVSFPGLEDTITLLRPQAVDGAPLMLRPHMRFGEVLAFSTTRTPHSAVWLEGSTEATRISAEIRLLLVD